MVYRDFLPEDERLLVVIVAGWGSNPSSIFQFEVVHQKQGETLLKPWDDVQICLVDHYMLWFIIIQRWTRRCLFVVFCLRHFETQRCEFVYCRMRYAWVHISWKVLPSSNNHPEFFEDMAFPTSTCFARCLSSTGAFWDVPRGKRTNMEHRKSRLKRKIVVPTSSFWVKGQVPLSLQGCRWIQYPCIF